MKRLTIEKKLRQIRLSAAVERSKEKLAQARRRGKSKQPRFEKRPHRSTKILAPRLVRYYALRPIRKSLERFLSDVESSLVAGNATTIDFSLTERLYPCGVLVLMGVVDDWLARFPGKLQATYPEDDLVEQMLQHVGVLAKLGLSSRKTKFHDDVTRWDYFTGMNVDATPIEPFMERVQKLVGEEKQIGLGDCVAEAMTNVKHHAYSGGAGGHWWIFATVTAERIFVAIYDRGASIPATIIAKPKAMDYFTGRIWARGRADGKLISAAAGGRTSTELPYRGKGLPEMLDFTRSHAQSELGIFSRNGFFRFDGTETHGRLQMPLTGTLIIWMLNLQGKRA